VSPQGLEQDERARGPRRPWLALGTGVLALSAVVGAGGMATGTLDLGDEITARLPFDSTPLAGAALLLVVAVPMAVVSALAVRRSSTTDLAALVAGVLLIGWIFLEVAVIRSFSWLQPTLLAAGVAVALAGLGVLGSSHPAPVPDGPTTQGRP
jgi:tellurite resistance protein TehA-like permease